ncbi:MAG: hypothetical protein ACLVEU_02660 [Bacteroides cellulosilyticus]
MRRSTAARDKLKQIAMDEAQKHAEETAQEIDAEHKERQSPFRFSMCGIQPGEEIEYCNNPEIKCTVVDDDKYDGHQGRSLLALGFGSSYSLAANTPLPARAISSTGANG